MIFYLLFLFPLDFRLTTASCIFNGPNTLVQDNFPTFISKLKISQSIIEKKENIGFGVWMKYQPYVEINNITETYYSQQWQRKYGYNLDHQFIFSFYTENEFQAPIFMLYISLDQNTQEIIYEMDLNFKKKVFSVQLSIESTNFEGQWIMFYIYFDVINLNTQIYLWNKQVAAQTSLNDDPFFTKDIKFQIGGFFNPNIYDQKKYVLSKFLGLLSNIFSSGNTLIFSDEEYFDACLSLQYNVNNCQQNLNVIISNTKLFDGSSYLNFLIQAQKSYILSGWIRLNNIKYYQTEALIIRISNNNQYDDQFGGDKVLYLKYYQNQQQQELNGFSLTTYSYDYPKLTKYTQKQDDTIQDFNEIFLDVLTEWHFIQYEFGTNTNEGQPVFQIYSVKISDILFYKWSKQINQFTLSQFNIDIGGDKFSQNFMIGQITQLQIQFYCDQVQTEMKIICHHSCESCFGPNENNCLTCSQESHRDYSNIQNTCNCQSSYTDILNIKICQQDQGKMPALVINEIDIACNKQGYNRCDSIIECSYGYFLYKKQCIQCPNYYNQQMILNLFCANCYLFPNEFSQNTLCYLNFIKYDDNKDYTYFEQQLKNSDFSYFIYQEKSDRQFHLVLSEGFLNDTTCLDGYLLLDQKCVNCIDNCKSCSNQIQCIDCFENFMLVSDVCVKYIEHCIDAQGPYQCFTGCEIGYFYYDYQCLSCVQNCSYCDEKYCRACNDPQKYYVTLNHINCAYCYIQNCLQCFQYFIYDGIIYSTLDLNYQSLTLDEIQILTGCGRCFDGFFYNFGTQKCELKCNGIMDQTLQDQCKIEFENCQFGVIESNQNDRICLIGQNGLQQYECQQIPNCRECILKYHLNNDFCIVCNSGYYSGIQSGQCYPCQINNCITCVQQNKQHLDYWKWNIKAFYKYFLNKDGNHHFEFYATIPDDSYFEIICLECKEGYLLFNHQCIIGCENNCLKCEIINSRATCIQCQKLYQGYLTTINSDGKCQQCPSNCNGCYSRTDQQIFQVNPYFIKNINNEIYSRICIESFKDEYDTHYFYDSYFQNSLICEQYEKCYKQVTITQKVFCSQISYQNYLDQNSLITDSNSILIDDIFSKVHMENLETQSLMDYLNQNSVREMELKYQFQTTENEACFFPQNISVYSTIVQNVFTLNKIAIIFEGTQNIIKFTSNVYFYNYTKISFHNFNIDVSIDSQEIDPQVNIYVQNLNLFSQLLLIQCQFTQSNSNFNSAFMTFYFDSPSSITLINTKISHFRQFNSMLFNLTSQNNNQSLEIQINNLIIEDCEFYNSQLFLITDNQQDFKYDVQIYDLKIVNTNFSESSILYIDSIHKQKQSNINLNNVQFFNVAIQKSSILFYQPTISDFQLKGLQLQKISISENSIFLKAIVFNLLNIICSNITLNNSTLISNDLKIQNIANQDDSIEASILIENFEISNILYDQYYSLFLIVNQNIFKQFQISVINLRLSNSQYSITKYKDFNEEIKYKSSLMYFDCNLCYFQDIKIVRGFGLPEISISHSTYLSIVNLHIILYDQFKTKTLSKDLDCILQQVYSHNQAIFINFYNTIILDRINIENCIVFDSPLILIQGYNQFDIKLEEQISLTNSIFNQNTLLVTKANRYCSIIAIISQQTGITNIFNVTFLNNHLNEYYQDVNSISATTIFFSQIKGDIQFNQINFQSNLATNTTNTILYIKSNTLQISDSIFTQNNIINYTQLVNKLLFFGIISDIMIDQAFQIRSNGGNGIINSCIIQLFNIKLIDSFSIFGGGFYINLYKDGIILINNSKFINTTAQLSSSYFSMGGCLYIDSQATSLNFTVYNTFIKNSYSRIKGGAIYIIPSLSKNIINFSGIQVKDCYATQDSFLSYSLAKSSNITSEVNMANISFQQTQDGFEQFLSQIDSLDSNIETLQLHNPLIFLQYGNVTFAGIQFLSIFIQYLIHLEQCEIIKFSNVSIKNSTYFYSPLIVISMSQEIQSEFLVQNMEIFNVSQINYQTNSICSKQETELFNIECPQFLNEKKFPQLRYSKNLVENIQLVCNLVNFLDNQFSSTSLILVNQIYENQIIRISNLTINQVNCNLCTSGVILFDFYQQMETQQLKISNSHFKNSQCGLTGCLSIFQNSSFLSASKRLLQQYNYDYFDNKIGYQVEIEQCLFINNSANYGASIFVQQTQIILKNSKFYKNQGQYGGSVYFASETKKLIIFNCIFTQNQAQIAGGIYSQNSSFQLLNQLDVYVNENNSTSFGNDITEKPRSLSVLFDNLKTSLNKVTVSKSHTKLVEQIVVQPYKIAGKEEKVRYIYLPSGQPIFNYSYIDEKSYQYTAYNLIFRILALDKFNKQEKKLTNQYCNLYPSVFNTTSNKQVNDYYYYLSYQQVYFNETSDDFNLDDLVILFNPNYPEEIILRILINCSMINIPIYDEQPPFQIINQITDYSLIFQIKTFPCQVGEYLNKTSGGCILCDSNQNQYSVTKESNGCQFKDNNKINKITPATIQLRETYWRAYFNSITIEYCYHLENNCQGGWLPGDESCVLGHIGGLCEQCDLYNIRNQGHYYSSNAYQCGDCGQIAGNIIIIMIIIIWTLVSIVLSVNSTLQTTEEFIIGQRLKCFGVTTIFTRVSTAILIKLFTNYLQIISTIASFQLKVPTGLFIAINSIGNPIQQGSYSLDCFLIKISQIEIIYFRLIWGLIMAICYILFYFLCGILGNIFKVVKFHTPQITTTLIYVFIYFQPNLISGLMSLISYREISDVRWVQGNVSYLYDTNTHIKWLLFFCVPLLLVFGITIPVNLWYGIFKNRFQLNTTKVRKIWGYLFNEYKLDAYFWETIKILQKEVILIVLIFYEDYVLIKASFVFLVLFAYSLYTTVKKPYMTLKLNELDSEVTIVCSSSIILGSSIYSAQKNNLFEIQLPSYVIIIILNALLAIKIISQIIFSYFTQFYSLLDKIKDLILKNFPRFMNYHPKIHRLLQSRLQQKKRATTNFAKIKKVVIPYAKKLIEFKRQNTYSNFQNSSKQKREVLSEEFFEDYYTINPEFQSTQKNKTSTSLYIPQPEN